MLRPLRCFGEAPVSKGVAKGHERGRLDRRAFRSRDVTGVTVAIWLRHASTCCTTLRAAAGTGVLGTGMFGSRSRLISKSRGVPVVMSRALCSRFLEIAAHFAGTWSCERCHLTAVD